jgi:hypothetical protein
MAKIRALVIPAEKHSSYAAGLLVFTLLVIILFASAGRVDAAPICYVDQQGANDEPGQKDLTEVCLDDANAPDTVEVSWNWDQIDWSGNNTGDACLLFDTDGDGYANSAACAYVSGSPAALVGYQFYTCNDANFDRCSGPTPVDPVDGSQSTCTVEVLPEPPATEPPADPFPEGDDYPYDTVATCTIDLDDVGGGTATPTDVCSYPSGEPNSDPSDCVLEWDPTAVSLSDFAASPSPIGPPMGMVILMPLGLLGLAAAFLLWRRMALNA